MFLRVILRRMKELGVSQTELARRMNASRPYVVKVLHGEVNITLVSAARFAHALQMDFIPTLTPRAAEATPQLEMALVGGYQKPTRQDPIEPRI